MEDALRKVLGILISLTIFIAANSYANAGAVSYRAQFDWVTEGSNKHLFELKVFVAESRAEIREGSRVVADCRANALSGEKIELDCRSTGLDRLAVSATLLPSGTLRFGNWLQGIDTVELRVQENHLPKRMLAHVQGH